MSNDGPLPARAAERASRRVEVQRAGLPARAALILREIVEAYVETGEPVGSRTLSRRLPLSLSPATIRNVMADLEEAGLIYAPHTSAGRLPTDRGLRLFVDGLLERGTLTPEEEEAIAARCASRGRSIEEVLEEASALLAGLSQAAGLVLVPKADAPLRHVEFVALGPGRVLVVLVGEDGSVENRIIEAPPGLPPSALTQATNYVNARLAGRTLEEARRAIEEEIRAARTELDALASKVVEAGLATWAGGPSGGALIVRGQAQLLADVTALAQLEAIRTLFERLEAKETLLKLLELAQASEGVQIFIGSENRLFETAGVTMIVAPYRNARERVVGAIGVIGPTRINYGRIIPAVDYTAKVIGRLLG